MKMSVARSNFPTYLVVFIGLLQILLPRAFAERTGNQNLDQKPHDNADEAQHNHGRSRLNREDMRGLRAASLISVTDTEDDNLMDSMANGAHDKSMLKNKTMMKNHMEKAELTGMSVITGFCMTGLHCWPMQVFAMAISAIHIISIIAAIYISASLYSDGIYSSKFYQGGGFILIGASLLGLASGIGISMLLDLCVFKKIALAGPMMSVFVAIVLIGRRGCVLGALGGTCAGVPIGTLMPSQEVGICLGAIIGFLIGCILGICPFFNNLDMNQRYLNRENQFGSFSEPGSTVSDDYHGYQNVIRQQTADYR